MTQAAKKKVFDGRYEILSIIGRGARSVVYRARHIESPDKELALKVLLDKDGGRNPSSERLRREALAMVSCRHKYVARLDDFHSIGSLCYLAMEYAPGSDLRSYMARQGGKVPVEQAERFLKQAAEGVSFIHKTGIIHRDIKPDNILVINDREIRITDFGVAILPGEECSIADLQSGVGTMNYMAPEILEGKNNDHRSDIYALGVVFYEALSGRNPFADIHLADHLDARKDDAIAPLPDEIPQYLKTVISKCLVFNPDERFQSCDELLEALISLRSEALDEKQGRTRKHTLFKQRLKRDPQAGTSEQPEEVPGGQEASTGPMPEPAAPSPENPSSGGETFQQASPYEEPVIESEQPPSNQNVSAPEDYMEPAGRQSHIAAPEPGSAADETREISEQEKKNHQKFVRRPTVQVHHTVATTGLSRAAAGAADAAENMGTANMRKIVFIVAGLVFFLTASVLFLKNTGTKQRAVEEEMAGTSVASLPLFNGPVLSFPNVPTGTYTGQISSIVPGRVLPMAMISRAEDDTLMIFVNTEGWTPVVINPRASTQGQAENAKSLRVTSNGMILEFTGRIEEGKIIGFFRNVVTGTQGQWVARPAKL